jgi:predicted anti-sigma-YlaC factor YlaD
MRCHEARQLFEDQLNGEMSPAERTLLNAHVRECATCARALDAARDTQERTRDGLRELARHAQPAHDARVRLTRTLTRAGYIKHDHRPAFALRALGAVTAGLTLMFFSALMMPKTALLPAESPAVAVPVRVSVQSPRNRATLESRALLASEPTDGFGLTRPISGSTEDFFVYCRGCGQLR